tara:strand:+ start:815 stop:1303 length:489 start_codon:yes stop_codon:yes gene_type:complete
MPGETSDKIMPDIQSAKPADYAGDVAVAEAWRVLAENPKAVLVDVRTRAEWTFVGVADLGAIGKEPLHVEWQSFPAMNVNEAFATSVADALKKQFGEAAVDVPVLMLCRSGVRSRAGAIALTAQGFHAAYNVTGGFEGDHDETRHRGQRTGWKAAGLPWVQA